MISSASSWARLSSHVMAGPVGSPASSRVTSVGIIPERPMPASEPAGRRRRACESTALAASIQSPGPARRGRRPVAPCRSPRARRRRGAPKSSSATPLRLDVPRSRPMYTVPRHPDLLVPADAPAGELLRREQAAGGAPGDVEGERLRRIDVLEAVEGDVAGGEADALQPHDPRLAPAAPGAAARRLRRRRPRGTAPRSRRPARSGARAGRTATASARPAVRGGRARAPAARAPARAPSGGRRCCAGARRATRARRAPAPARAPPLRPAGVAHARAARS